MDCLLESFLIKRSLFREWVLDKFRKVHAAKKTGTACWKGFFRTGIDTGKLEGFSVGQ